MKVCLINSLYKPYSRGGAEVVFENIVNGLQASGHEVVVITIKPFDGLSSLLVDNNRIPLTPFDKGAAIVYRFYPLNIFSFINISRHNIFSRLIWHIFDVFNLHSYFAVKNILKKEKPDMVMTHNLKGIGYLAPRAIKRLKIKWIHTIHDVQLVEPSGVIIKDCKIPPAPLCRKGAYEMICRWLFDSPDVLISPSKWLLDFYRDKGFFSKSKTFILPNPISHQSLILSRKPTNDKQQAVVTFLYLGQIEKHKGVLFLMEVFKKILNHKSSIINLKLLIAGGGSKLEEIKKIAADEPQIEILGPIQHEKISAIFSETDFTIVPSLCYENSPTVICESFVAGVPVIAAKIGGVAELVKDGVNGFTFEAGDEEDLLRVLKICLENKNELDRMRVEVLKSVEDYGIRKYITKLLEI